MPGADRGEHRARRADARRRRLDGLRRHRLGPALFDARRHHAEQRRAISSSHGPFTPATSKGPDDPDETTAENIPLKVGDMLYLCSKHDHVIALDPATGEKRWEFDPKIEVSHDFQHLNCRGLAYHDATRVGSAAAAPRRRAATRRRRQRRCRSRSPPTASSAPHASAAAASCLKRVILPSIDARLFALDAATGQPCAGFGKNGVVELPSTWATSSRATTWRRRRRW